MTNIWRFIASDNPNREKLKEVKGIGTPATRDQIIAKLEATNGKGHKLEPYITKKGKSTELIPTPIGCALIDTIDQSLTYPDTTAVMEYELSNIASGKISRDAYITTVIDLVNRNVTHAETVVYPAPPGKKSLPAPFAKPGSSFANIPPSIPCTSGYAAIKTAYRRSPSRPSFTKTMTASQSWPSALTTIPLCPAGKGSTGIFGNAGSAIAHITMLTVNRISLKRKNQLNN